MYIGFSFVAIAFILSDFLFYSFDLQLNYKVFIFLCVEAYLFKVCSLK